MSHPEWYWDKRLAGDWQADCDSLAAWVADRYDPESVLDLGCAVGNHLRWFYERGVTVRGVERSPGAISKAVVPSGTIDRHDLTEPYRPGRTFDVVLCIEVAEHLPETAADTLVETIDRCASDVVVFSAATPDATGRGHVNEQPRDYWRERFDAYGWEEDAEALELLRKRVTTHAKHWVPERLFVFR